MSSVNKAILVGNLGKEPETTYTQSGTPLCKFSIATSEKFKSGDEWKESTEWHNVVVWGAQGGACGKFLKKGSKVFIEGRIETRSWDDESTGQKRYMTQIVGQKVVFLDKKPAGAGNDTWDGGQQKQSGFGNFDQQKQGFGSDDDIPF